MKPVRRRYEVILDLAEIYAWIADRNPDPAERFLVALDLTFEQIGKNPGIGWERSWKSNKLQGIRSWRVRDFRNFRIFYREEKSAVEIYAVLRGSRHLERMLKKR